MNHAILVFVAITYALSIGLSLVIGLTGGHESRLVGLGYATMFVPALAVFVVQSGMDEVPGIDWRRFPLKYLPVALLLIPVVNHAVMLPVTAALAGGLPWQNWLTPQADGLYHTPASRGWGVLTIQGLAGRIAINAGIGLIIVSILAFFEEVGWRAWLLPRLVERIGARRAVVVTALLWALWHTPFALSGIQHIDGIPASRLAVMMPIDNIGIGLVIGWLWLRTESIWMVSLAHGALNNWGQYAFKYMQDLGPGVDESLILDAGGLAMFLLGGLLLARGMPSTR
jgi:membrane protease YdiL (CAAX protease family)